jgi:hypothetical protein
MDGAPGKTRARFLYLAFKTLVKNIPCLAQELTCETGSAALSFLQRIWL